MIVSLISGGTADSELLVLDDTSYHIFRTDGLSGARLQDLTNDIRRADKLAIWPAFDVDKDNRRLSNERAGGYGPVGRLSESTGGALLEQLATDPLGAPLDALNKGINQIFTAPGVIKLAVIVGVLAVGVYLVKRKLP